MADCERLFNELTHKYLDLVYFAHLHCIEDSVNLPILRAAFRDLKVSKNEASLALFSQLLRYVLHRRVVLFPFATLQQILPCRKAKQHSLEAMGSQQSLSIVVAPGPSADKFESRFLD